MAQQKFFSGLTEGMIKRSAGERPDRQKSQFFWPDEYAPDAPQERSAGGGRPRTGGRPSQAVAVEPPPAQSNGSAADERRGARAAASPPPAKATINARLFGQRAGRDEVDERMDVPIGVRPADNGGPPPTRDRPLKNSTSHIQFYDGVESSFGELERSKAHERRRIEQFLRQQSEEDTGEAARAKRHSTLQSKIEFYDYPEPPSAVGQRVLIHRIVADRSTPDSDKTGIYGRLPGATTTAAGGGIRRQEQPLLLPDYVDADADETLYRDDESEFDDRSSYRSSVCSSSYAPSGFHRRSNTQLPEHKRNSQRHLRSSINFHDGCTIADDSEASRKPLSVRESATTRIGVGLPNL